MAMSMQNAWQVLSSIGLSGKEDWYELSISKKSEVFELAKKWNYTYQSPLGRSVGYSFYLHLQRKQGRKD